MDSDEYKVLLGRLVGYELSPTVLADVEAYRNYCEKQAWNNGVALALASVDRGSAGERHEQLKPLCPYGR